MLAFFNWGAPEQCKVFSIFADISPDNLCDVNKSFGSEPYNDFRPWGIS